MTAAQRRIVAQRGYLKKFMCVIATMPVLAAIAVYNRIELVMWWVIVLPLVGIALALYWRRQLGIKLQRLDEENSQLSLPLDRESTIRVPRTPNPEDGEVLPPPDYQASIITPPAYIIAPRKVPSYRSLENLFAFGRTRSQRLAAAAAAAAANAAITAEEGTATASESEQAQQQHQQQPSSSPLTTVPQVTVTEPISGKISVIYGSNQQNNPTRESLPEMREIGPRFGECTMQVLNNINNPSSPSTSSTLSQESIIVVGKKKAVVEEGEEKVSNKVVDNLKVSTAFVGSKSFVDRNGLGVMTMDVALSAIASAAGSPSSSSSSTFSTLTMAPPPSPSSACSSSSSTITAAPSIAPLLMGSSHLMTPDHHRDVKGKGPSRD
ncbi:hypothetical protein BG004_004248 [Podila humilis]|nr:hypothetical protein BG004_004248 [Podila humilis]